jgi:pyrimidine-specific ribonucleoside hydrolase
MGIRAREYFGAGIDEMQVVSYAGTNPPFSCMNDGLQISTGATLGHGLIKLKADSLKLPKADFTYMNRKISINLKIDYQKRVESEIKNLVILYGLDTNLYWDLVRKRAIDYWKYWDRHEIFELQITE